jgi:hypothetical protein
MDQPATKEEVESWLFKLKTSNRIFLHSSMYSLQDNPLILHRRLEGEERAKALLRKANKVGRFLFKFPFVIGIGVSGSLSKNFADEKADIDFFIIARSNRLWIARTFMHLFKKLTFLTGKQHYYCMNYYIDETVYDLPEKNIFTAIELKTLLPVAGANSLNDFFNSNTWSDEWLPSCSFRKQEQKDPRAGVFKRTMEFLFNNKIGNSLDRLLYRITSLRWKRKQERGKKNEKGVTMGLMTDRHFAKSDPGGFQAIVLKEYAERVAKNNI